MSCGFMKRKIWCRRGRIYRADPPAWTKSSFPEEPSPRPRALRKLSPHCLRENETMKRGKTAVIIGAGPAGLTAAYELLTRTGIKPVVLEKSTYMGGISRTVNYKGNRIDIGGHRFFSKSDRVMQWWLQMLPLQASEDGPVAIKYHRMEREIIPSASRAVATATATATPVETADGVMLLRARK